MPKGVNPFTKEQRIKALRTQLANLGEAETEAVVAVAEVAMDDQDAAAKKLDELVRNEEAF